jgi:DHA1 family bicyclomycin/chloramphenicol resistance-like MFS transporter
MPKPASGPPPVAMLVAFTAIGPLALNLLVPSVPGIAADLGAGYATAQLTLTLYLVGIAAGQLVYGPLSDRFGRRPVMLAGLAVFAAASAAGAFASSIGLLIGARIAQAVGGCAGMVLSRAMVHDVYGRERSASVLAYVVMAMAVAPALGGFLDAWFGWRAGFHLTTAVGASVLAWAAFRLPETCRERRAPPGALGMARGFGRLLSSRAFLGFALTTSFASAVYFGFLAGAPYVMDALLGLGPESYGPLFVLISLGYMAGSFAAARLSVRLGPERMLVLGTAIGLAGTALMAVLTVALGVGPLVLFLPMTLCAAGNGIGNPNGVAAAISVDPRAAGTASGLLGALQMGIGAVATVAVGAVQGTSAVPMTLVLLAFAVVSLAALALGLRSRNARIPAVAAAD